MNEEQKKAIERLTNLAQEKNNNWLGSTNIAAMKIVLDMLNPDMDYICKQLSIIAKESGFSPDEILDDYRAMERKALEYDELVKKNKELELENQALKNNQANCPAMNTSGFKCNFKKYWRDK